MDDKTKIVEVYTDGSSLGNPGISGTGYIIRYWEMKDDKLVPGEIEGSQGFKLSTNNRMEIMGAIYGISFALELIEVGMLKDIIELSLFSDSQYLCDSIVKGWLNKWSKGGWVTSTQKPVKNKDLWEAIIVILEKLNTKGIKLIVNHIPGHQGFEFNERADKLCTDASKDTSNHIIDTVYEESIKNRSRFNYNN